MLAGATLKHCKAFRIKSVLRVRGWVLLGGYGILTRLPASPGSPFAPFWPPDGPCNHNKKDVNNEAMK